jgi:hypothetical protein
MNDIITARQLKRENQHMINIKYDTIVELQKIVNETRLLVNSLKTIIQFLLDSENTARQLQIQVNALKYEVIVENDILHGGA